MTSALATISGALPALLQGAAVTLAMSLVAIVFAVAIGIVLALGRQSRFIVVRWLARAYVSFGRGTPLFIQILIVFFVLPAMGIDIDKFYAAVVALSLNSGAYISEMIRGGLTAIKSGQIEAARAVAMPQSLVWRRIIFPQVMILILPPLTTEFIALVKGSSLASIIGVIELTRAGYLIISVTYKPIEIWMTVGVLYFILCFPLGAITRIVERATSVYRLQ